MEEQIPKKIKTTEIPDDYRCKISGKVMFEPAILIKHIQEENAAASESAIRDADIAQETIRFTRNQILVSAGTTVLAQANVVPQTALQLLGT